MIPTILASHLERFSLGGQPCRHPVPVSPHCIRGTPYPRVPDSPPSWDLPALPTLTSTGSTRALSAKALILAGMVAENISVWRWPRKNDRMSRTSSSNPTCSGATKSRVYACLCVFVCVKVRWWGILKHNIHPGSGRKAYYSAVVCIRSAPSHPYSFPLCFRSAPICLLRNGAMMWQQAPTLDTPYTYFVAQLRFSFATNLLLPSLPSPPIVAS